MLAQALHALAPTVASVVTYANPELAGLASSVPLGSLLFYVGGRLHRRLVRPHFAASQGGDRQQPRLQLLVGCVPRFLALPRPGGRVVDGLGDSA